MPRPLRPNSLVKSFRASELRARVPISVDGTLTLVDRTSTLVDGTPTFVDGSPTFVEEIQSLVARIAVLLNKISGSADCPVLAE
jgi:hypothetical protein